MSHWRVESITKQILVDEYIIQKKTMKQIAKDHSVSVGLVYNRIHHFGIEPRKTLSEESKRKIGEANKGRPSHTKGKHLSEETKKKLSLAKKGVFLKPSEFGGRRKKREDGYISVFCPSHPYASNDGMVMEHRLVMEKHIGRYVKADEVVHHKNGIRDDNRIENLQLMTFKEHCSYHMTERWKNKKRSEDLSTQ